MNQKVNSLDSYELIDEWKNSRCTIRCWRPKGLTEEDRLKSLKEFKEIAIEMATELQVEIKKDKGAANI